jgi:hypothetical protein
MGSSGFMHPEKNTHASAMVSKEGRIEYMITPRKPNYEKQVSAAARGVLLGDAEICHQTHRSFNKMTEHDTQFIVGVLVTYVH